MLFGIAEDASGDVDWAFVCVVPRVDALPANVGDGSGYAALGPLVG